MSRFFHDLKARGSKRNTKRRALMPRDRASPAQTLGRRLNRAQLPFASSKPVRKELASCEEGLTRACAAALNDFWTFRPAPLRVNAQVVNVDGGAADKV
jgi:hypothetical protein